MFLLSSGAPSPAWLPPPEIALGPLQLGALATFALIGAAFFGVLRSALLHSVPARILEGARSDRERDSIRPKLERAEALATSATVFEITCQIVLVILVMNLANGFGWHPVILSILIATPLLVFASQVVPAVLRGDTSDALLLRALPTFDLVQRPLAALTLVLESVQRGLMHIFRTPVNRSTRRVVEDLRDVIEDADLEGELDETERELIENVVDVHEVDVSEVMTPRTEIEAVQIDAAAEELMNTIANSGHTRIPVYEKDLDSIVGLVYAQDVIAHAIKSPLSELELRPLLRPVSFIPETKHVSDLLVEFRRDRQKTAVVIDEYGGTAGLITLGDIVAEIVGDMRDELGEDAPEAIQELEPGLWSVQGNTRISEVNEQLTLELPEEEDFETLAGYLLSEFGRFPSRGESMVSTDIEFVVTDASDRRILMVNVRRLPERGLVG